MGFSLPKSIRLSALLENLPTPGVGTSLEPSASSADDSLVEINANLRKPAYAPTIWILTGAVSFALLLRLPIAAFAVLVLGSIAGVIAHGLDRERRTSDLMYDLDDASESDFARLSSAVEILNRTARVWLEPASTLTTERMNNAGVTNLLRRHVIQIGTGVPPLIRTNLLVWGIELERGVGVFFFPDKLYLHGRSGYRAFRYDSLEVAASGIDYREGGPLPDDAAVIGQTWQYVRLDGGPERRFWGNRRIPVVRYGQVTLTSGSGLHVVLSVSNAQIAHHFANALHRAGPLSHRAPEQGLTGKEADLVVQGTSRAVEDELRGSRIEMTESVKRVTRLTNETVLRGGRYVLSLMRLVNPRQYAASLDRLTTDIDQTFRALVDRGPGESTSEVHIASASPNGSSPPTVALPSEPTDPARQGTRRGAEDTLGGYATEIGVVAKRFTISASEARRRIGGNNLDPKRRVKLRRVAATFDRLVAEMEEIVVPSSAQFDVQHQAITLSIKEASQMMTATLSVWDPQGLAIARAAARAALERPPRRFATLIADLRARNGTTSDPSNGGTRT